LIKTVGAFSGAVAESRTGALGGVMAVCGVGFFSGEEHADKRKTPKTNKLPKIHEPRR